MKYEHSSIASQHVELKRFFAEFILLAREIIKDFDSCIYVISEKGFNSQDYVIHGREVRFSFELVFKQGGVPLGQIVALIKESEEVTHKLDQLHFDRLGNLLSEGLSMYNIAQPEGTSAILNRIADQVVDYATIKV